MLRYEHMPVDETDDKDGDIRRFEVLKRSLSLSPKISVEDRPVQHNELPSREGDHGKGFFHRAKTHFRSQYKILLAGQVLSFSLSVTGAAQATLYFDCNLSAPTFTVGLFYFALIFCLIPVYLDRKNMCKVANHHPLSQSDVGEVVHHSTSGTEDDSALRPEMLSSVAQIDVIPSAQYAFLGVPLHNAVWKYFCMALLDVYANYFTVLAFSYTTITSVTLFDALAIPTAMVMSSLLLSRKYTKLHLLAVCSCSIGILLNVFQDYEHDRSGLSSNINRSQPEKNDVYSHKLRGDVLAILGGVLFGINNTVSEIAVRGDGGPNEYLGMLGVLATCICTIQSLIFERDEISEFFNSSADKSPTCKESTAWIVLFAYFFSSILCYVGASRFLQVSEACFYNLSLLTGDMWSVVYSVVAQRIVPPPLFFVAMVFILSGVVLYEMAPSPTENTLDGNQLCIRGDDKTISAHNKLQIIDTQKGSYKVSQAANMSSYNRSNSWRQRSNPQCLEHVDEVELATIT